jgi:hypothetical protein
MAKKKPPRAPAGPKKNGRPTKYDPTLHPTLAEAWAGLPKTDAEIAAKLGVSETTFTAWKRQHPELSGALKSGKEEPDALVERSLFERATGYSHPHEEIFCHQGDVTRVQTTKHYPPDQTSIIFYLCNRMSGKWRHVQHVVHEGKVDLQEPDDAREAQRLRLGRIAKLSAALGVKL